MATVACLSDDEAPPEARLVFQDIRTKRNTDYVNNFWRALAHDPAELRAVWEKALAVMAPGALDPLVKELVYVAVSVTNGCAYCVHSHTAAARAKGMTSEMYSELLAVLAMAMQTNALATAMGVEVDERFKRREGYTR